MEKKKLRLGNAISNTLKLSARFPLLVVIPGLIYFVVAIIKLNERPRFIIPLLSSPMFYQALSNNFILFLINLLLSFIFISGFLRIVMSCGNEMRKPDWKDFFSWNFPQLGGYLAIELIYTIAITLGFILLVIPGLMIAVFLLFTPYVFLDQRLTIHDAITRSIKIVEGLTWPLLGMVFLFIIYKFILGSGSQFFPMFSRERLVYSQIIVFIGSFITVFINLVMVHLYFDLSAQTVNLEAPEPKELVEEKL